MARLLFIRATTDYSEPVVDHMKQVCGLLDIEFVKHDFVDLITLQTFAKTDSNRNGNFQFLYLAAHGNHDLFGEKSGPHNRWADFGYSLCESESFDENSVFFLGCCYGGLRRIAIILFCNCPQIATVCGPKWKVDQYDVALGLHTFLHAQTIRKVEPSLCAKRTENATGCSFFLYSRFDYDDEIAQILGFFPDSYYTTQQLKDVR